MALAIMVSTRLWLCEAIYPRRDLDLIQTLANKIRNLALCRLLLLAVDSLARYVTAFRKAFRTALPRRKGEMGRPQLISWPNIAIVKVVKQRQDGRLNISRLIVQGSETMVKYLIQKTQAEGVINTDFIERFNATFRQRLNCLVRHTRTLARKVQTLETGMYVVGCLYSFCHPHRIIACASSYRLTFLDIARFNVLRQLRPFWPTTFGLSRNCSICVSIQLVGNRPLSAVAVRWLLRNSSKCGAHDHVYVLLYRWDHHPTF